MDATGNPTVAEVTYWPIDQLCRPVGCVYLADFPNLEARCAGAGDGDAEGLVRIEYVGSKEDLIAAGVATPEMLGPGRPGRRRVDAAGREYQLRAWWVNVPRAPERRYCVTVWGDPSRLPGARDAIAVRFVQIQWREPKPVQLGGRTRPSYLRVVK